MTVLTSLFRDFDIAEYLPTIDTLFGKMSSWCWLFIMIAPVLLLLFGLKFFFLPAKTPEGIGFRNYFVTGTNESWQFAQRIAGLSWMVVGGLLVIVGLIMGTFLGAMEPIKMMTTVIVYLCVQLVLVILLYIAVIAVTLKFYDRNGNPR
jgi:uncharacterized membrane protein